MSNYRVAETIPTEIAGTFGELHQLTKQLLYTRGVETESEARSFTTPSYDEGLHDPFLLNDMSKAVDRILEAVESKQKIVIFSDYDCDGIPGAVVLHDFFKAIGYEDFINYIPHRHYEGFGFNKDAAKKLAGEGAELIITIDCGITDIEAVETASELGVDVIITDHHEPRKLESGEKVLPQAVAVVNPKVGETYPFQGLCGAAVIYKLVQAMITAGHKKELFSIPVGREKWWLDMVGIATIADMVPLIDENRVLAHYGLRVLRKSRRPGIQKLLRKQRLDPRYLAEDDIGFTIGPRINAASRMDSPEDAFKLLATKDEGEADTCVTHLEKLNNERKGQAAAMTKEAHKRLKEMAEIPDVVVMGNPEWRPSLVGLVANKLAEEYKRPAFLWGRDGNGVFKGSCRSGGGVSVVRLMVAASGYFLEHGGHHMSGGFSVRESHIHTLNQGLEEAFVGLSEGALIDDELVVDASVSLDDIDRSFLSAQQSLAPFGIENPKPLYEVVNVTPTEVVVFGKTKEHTKITFESGGMVKEAIAFFRLPEQFSTEPKVGQKLTLLAHLEQSYFMGRQQTRLRMVDVF